MFFLSLITLGIATITTYLSINSQEEIFKVGMATVAIIFGLLSLFFAPWELKLLVIVIPFILEKIATKSRQNWTN